MADEAEVAAEPLERELAPWGRVIYSLATLVLPLLMFLAMMAVIKGLFTDAYMEQLTKAVETEDSWTSYGQLVAQQKAALAIAEFVARIRFAAPQALLISISYVTIAIALAVAAAVVRAHGRLGPDLGLVALAVVCVTIAAIWIVNHNGLNLRIGNLSLYIIPHVLERVQFEGATQLPALMEARAAYGASVGFAAAGAVVLAAAILAYRWRRPGVWFRPLVLRRQMNCLLVLFAVASILLVFSNTAVRSLVEWPAGLLKPSATVARAAAAPAAGRPGAAGSGAGGGGHDRRRRPCRHLARLGREPVLPLEHRLDGDPARDLRPAFRQPVPRHRARRHRGAAKAQGRRRRGGGHLSRAQDLEGRQRPDALLRRDHHRRARDRRAAVHGAGGRPDEDDPAAERVSLPGAPERT